METKNKLNNGLHDLKSGAYIHDLFELSARQYSDEVAIIFEDKTISYQALHEQADRLANTILNLNPESELIGISTSRSIEMVIGVLAILKSGKAYLPLDPSYPENRLRQVISDSGILFCVTPNERDRKLFDGLGVKTIANPDRQTTEMEMKANRKSDLAYVLYTSGSTGQPKGVCMGHSALVNLLKWQEKNSGAGKDTLTLQFAPLSFDVSFQEIFSTLTTGGTLVLIEDHLRLDPLALLHLIDDKNISRLFLPFVALQYLAEMAVSFKLFPACLKEVITAGEQLKITPQVEAFFKELSGCTLSNQYGPTECHVVSELKLTGDSSEWPKLPNIGKPIENVQIFILNDDLKLMEDGNEGELCISGDCLANGYLHQHELTSEKFIQWQHPEKGTLRIYRTGDLARYLPNHEIEFLGRKDQQVKIRGNRIELGEIEVVLTRQPGVKQVAVVADENTNGEKRLVAYIISDSGSKDNSEIRNSLLGLLPEYMVPSHYVWLDEFPKTSSGKIDRKALPKPEFNRPELATIYKKPATLIEKNIATIWMEVLQISKIGANDNFFELGGNSILSQRTVTLLKNRFNYDLPITKLYQFPAIADIAEYLSPNLKKKAVAVKKRMLMDSDSNDIAVIGMTGRFPGADSPEELWELLKEGKETIHFFSKDELDKFIPDNIKNDPEYVPARGILNDVVNFDASFFGINPRLAELMDPQQRVFLEIAWEVLEKTGYSPQKYDGVTGVFAGTGNNTYYPNNVKSNTKLIEAVGGFQVMTVNEKDYVSSRTAYELNLKGPAVSVFSGCSTSHLAIAQAVESIRKGTCDIAVAGGVSITSPVNSGHLYQEGAMLSADGHCRPFDDIAGGTVFSDGAGVVLLKNLKSAIEDGDTIFGVIKGIGVNNDGAGKGSFTAPSAEGQAGAIRMAIEESGIDPSTISYVEAHGTGTPLGDPIEIEGLQMAFGEQEKHQFCAIGSVKGNIGHLTAAAGVTGLIKTCLSLYHKQIPASIGYDKPNHNIDFVKSPFYVNNKLAEWKSDSARRAGVSSFGVGGTNVHIILEEYSHPESALSESKGRPFQLLNWSAKSAASIEKYGAKLADYIRQNNEVDLADMAYTLQKYRSDFNHRRFIVAASSSDFLNQLLLENVSGAESNTLTEVPGEVVFSFPGQGAQYLNMGKELYASESVYRDAIDICASILQPYLKCDIRDIIYPSKPDAAAEEILKNTRYTQPAIFITEYAVSRLWMSWGIQPSILCGHSIGEFVAAHLAGVFSLEDALQLIASRGLMVSELPKGSMLSVRLSVDELSLILPEHLSIAAVNNRKLCVVAGTDENIAMFSKQLDQQEIPNKVLVTSHAFHSSMMDPIIEDFRKVVELVQLNKPTKPVVSTVTGTWLKDEQAIDTHYWANHLRKTVRFADALDTIAELDKPLFIEAGPGNVTSTLAKQQTSGSKVKVITSLERSDSRSEYFTLLKALGQVWLNGIEPDLDAVYMNQNRKKTILPTYAFDKKHCWVEPKIETNNNSLNFNNYSYTIEAVDNSENQITSNTQNMRKETLFNKIKQLLEDASGIEMTNISPNMSFLEIGLDSLLLTQVAITFKREFGLPITFRQLNESFGSPALLIEYLDSNLPKEAFATETETKTAPAIGSTSGLNQTIHPNADPSISLMAQQIQMLANQLAMMQNNQKSETAVSIPASPSSGLKNSVPNLSELSPEEAEEIKKPFGATARIEKQKTELNSVQASFLKNLTERYNKKTGQSKAYAQNNRAHMSDPRVVSGFKPLTKEIVYPIVVNKSKGSRLWDIEGNEYIDALNGFGASMLGHQPDFIKKAVQDQVEQGYEVGPQHELAGEVTRLICELTGHDRSALCSTGSEAVLGTMRIARTVTGRSLIVAFSGSYHGIVDEVIVRGTKKLKSFPAAPGIMPEAVQNMLILDYGTDESLRIIKERAHELAAILVEPVQSRRPEFVPIEFLKKVRQIATDSGVALIFDEVITGFRMHPGGAQALFGIKADIASYGKVVGAGIPIGVIAGKKEFMDALDGGFWQYGDDSYPEIGVTYFAGTFVRHPLALASAKAALSYMKSKGPELQNSINRKAQHLADTMNKVFEDLGLTLYVAQFGSLWKIKYKEEIPYSELLFTLMREKGIHIWDGFPCFMTEAHTDAEVEIIINCFRESISEMIEGGFFTTSKQNTDSDSQLNDTSLNPPVPGARLGRDQNGNPAWFVADPNQPGKYLKLNIG